MSGPPLQAEAETTVLRSRIVPLLFSLHVIGATHRARADSAPASHVADFQNWNELDLSTQMSRRTQLTFALLERWSANLGEPSTYATGIDMNLEASRVLSLTSSYYYSQSQTQAGHWAHSHLPLLAVTVADNEGPCVFTDRHRVVGVLGDASRFWVYQNRPKVDCRLGSVAAGVSVILWDELSYYSIFNGWTRNRVAAGIRASLTTRWALDLYYLHQRDFRAQPGTVHGIGVTLEVRP
jgi:hypothetical protein